MTLLPFHLCFGRYRLVDSFSCSRSQEGFDDTVLHRFVAYLFGSLWWIAPISVYTAMFMASLILNAVCLLIVEIIDKDHPQLISATHHMHWSRALCAWRRTSSSLRPRSLDFPESEFPENEAVRKLCFDETESLLVSSRRMFYSFGLS